MSYSMFVFLWFMVAVVILSGWRCGHWYHKNGYQASAYMVNAFMYGVIFFGIGAVGFIISWLVHVL